MKVTDIREMNPDELTSELDALRTKLYDIRTQAVTEKLEDPSQLSKLRRDIARFKTVIRERELASSKGAK